MTRCPCLRRNVDIWSKTRLFKGHRMLIDVAVGDSMIQAYTDTEQGRELADGPVWLGWNASSLTLLHD